MSPQGIAALSTEKKKKRVYSKGEEKSGRVWTGRNMKACWLEMKKENELHQDESVEPNTT